MQCAPFQKVRAQPSARVLPTSLQACLKKVQEVHSRPGIGIDGGKGPEQAVRNAHELLFKPRCEGGGSNIQVRPSP
jgi:hypothetical protein